VKVLKGTLSGSTGSTVCKRQDMEAGESCTHRGTDKNVVGMYNGTLLLLLLSRFSRVRPCATPQTAAHQGPPSLGFSRQGYWSGVPLPSPTMEYYSAIKRNEIMPFAATWTDLEIIILKEVSQTKTNVMLLLICWIWKKEHTNELIYKIDPQTQKINLWLPKGKGGKR
jgi:hypothetical protein